MRTNDPWSDMFAGIRAALTNFLTETLDEAVERGVLTDEQAAAVLAIHAEEDRAR